MPWVKNNLFPNNVVADGKAACLDVKTSTQELCINTPVEITPITTGAVVKVPTVLAELTLNINLDTIIRLPEPAIEIKRIKKRVKVTQCLLIQDTNILFIKGFIRKNIEYATPGWCSTKEGICGDIKHCTIDAPFSCTTPLFFNGTSPLDPEFNKTREFEYLREEKLFGPEFGDKDKLMSGDFREFNQVSTEFFNELPYCELVSARIVEFDEILNPKPLAFKAPFEEKKFTKIEEKAVLFLTLKILQNRQVAVGPVPTVDC
ncbi:MAG: CsxC family protein [Bacillota bacterium]